MFSPVNHGEVGEIKHSPPGRKQMADRVLCAVAAVGRPAFLARPALPFLPAPPGGWVVVR